MVGVEHNVEALTKLFKGASVVSNMVGPFIKYGSEVVEACLAAGCHYTDTTGEQDWVLHAQKTWGDAFAKKNLLLSPNLAQMYTTGEIAANICLETPGLDTLDILVFWKGFPTYASTQTIFTILKADWYYLEQNKFVEWDVTARRCGGARPARDGHRRAMGRHRASGVVQERSARGQLPRDGRRAGTPGDGRRGPDHADG